MSAQKLTSRPAHLGPIQTCCSEIERLPARRHRPGELDGLEIVFGPVGLGHEVLGLSRQPMMTRSPSTMRSSAGSTRSATVSGRGTKRLAGVAMSKD